MKNFKKILLSLGLVFVTGIFVIGCFFGGRCTQSSPYDISLANALNTKNIIPIAILGSGPAGYSAGVYGTRSGYKTVIIEGNRPGGALMETTYIENWPGRKKILGSTLMGELKDHALQLGAEVIADAVERVDFSSWPFALWTENGKKLHALSVIIATGSTPRKLGVPGEDEYWGKGVTTCAICDAPYHKGKDVVVIGGGDSAVEEALQLSPHAKTVTVLVRKNHMRAAASGQERLKVVPNITIKYNTEITEILGDDQNVTGVTLFNNKTNETSTKEVTGVFLAIGHLPNTDIFKDYLKMDNQGYVLVKGRTQEASLPGIFSAGDVQDKHYKQAAVAAGNGVKAALDASAFLQEHGFNTEVMEKLEPNLFEPFFVERKRVSNLSNLQELERLLNDTEKLVVVDFYADYCPSCMQMLPAIETVAHQLVNDVVFYKVDMTEAPDIAKQYHVGSIPCIIVFKNGKEIARFNDAMSKKQLLTFVKQFIDEPEE